MAPFRLQLIAIGTAVAILCGCAGEPQSLPSDTITIAVQGDAKSLDPHLVTDAASMRMIENMYSTLLRYGRGYQAMALEPDLAEAVDISQDGLVYTIKLVSNATFHHGRPVVAQDVAYSIQRIIDVGVRARHFAAVDTIETPDDRTVILRLTCPCAALRTHLANPMNAIMDRQVVAANGDNLRNADGGSGPYRLIDWQPGQHLELHAHAGYHATGLPKTPRLIYRPMPDQTARSTAIRTGEVHILHEVPHKDRQILMRAEGVRVEAVPGTFWEYIGINCTRPPLNDARVRQAIAWAVDRSQLNRAIKFGQATALLGGHLPPNHWAHAEFTMYPKPDLDRARQLLASAGVESGLEIEMLVDANVDDQVRGAEMVKQQLAQVGITVRVRGLEPSLFYQRLNDRDFDTTLVGWMGFVDPDEWVGELFHSNGSFNQQGYANEQLDLFIEQAARRHDRTERLVLYDQIERIIAQQAPMVFLYVNPHTTALRDRVSGYHVHPTGTTLFVREAVIQP